MSNLLFILGGSDPEMALIERLAREAGEKVVYACVGNDRVHPGNAYKADNISDCLDLDGYKIVLVECDLPGWFSGDPAPEVVVVDHHRKGDPGYGKLPEEFLAASSIGQVLSVLADEVDLPSEFATEGWLDDAHGIMRDMRDRRTTSMGETVEFSEPWGIIPTKEVLMTAAADHCLEPAYRGKCPGVDPDELMKWRAESRAAFRQKSCLACKGTGLRGAFDCGHGEHLEAGCLGCYPECPHCSVAAVLVDVESARFILKDSVERCKKCGARNDCHYPSGCCDEDSNCWPEFRSYADLRGKHVPELPEAAAREGIPFLSTVQDRDGRSKVVLMAAPPELISEFMKGKLVSGLKDIYGDPARGFAGGYLP